MLGCFLFISELGTCENITYKFLKRELKFIHKQQAFTQIFILYLCYSVFIIFNFLHHPSIYNMRHLVV